MAFAILNSIKDQQSGIGIAGPIVTATGRPTADATLATQTTTALATAVNRGKVHVAITAVDAAVKIASVLVTLIDNTPVTPVTISIGGYNPAAADQVAGQGVNLACEFCTDLNIVKAAAAVTPSGAKGGTIEYQCDLELTGV